MERETGYGNYAYTAEPQVSKRSPDVALKAIERCEQLAEEVNFLCVRVGELTRELDEAKAYIEVLRGNKNVKIQESKV